MFVRAAGVFTPWSVQPFMHSAAALQTKRLIDAVIIAHNSPHFMYSRRSKNEVSRSKRSLFRAKNRTHERTNSHTDEQTRLNALPRRYAKPRSRRSEWKVMSQESEPKTKANDSRFRGKLQKIAKANNDHEIYMHSKHSANTNDCNSLFDILSVGKTLHLVYNISTVSRVKTKD